MFGRDSMFLDLINELGLEQQVYEHAKRNHILDLVLTFQPNAICKTGTVVGMSS